MDFVWLLYQYQLHKNKTTKNKKTNCFEFERVNVFLLFTNKERGRKAAS